ncbi:MAG: DedA family protein [Chloroflexota bacterium]|nr:DedA family protein [Chloroflexota bacterium]
MHTIMHLLLHTSPLLIYLVVAVLLALESTGIPIVNSTLLLLMGALAAAGHFNIVSLAIVSIAGSVGGACIAYTIGARTGRRIMLRLALFFHLDRHRISLFERWFQRYGIWMVFASRIIPYIRPFACFPAGFSRTNFARFVVGVTVGSVIWCTGMLAIGWSLGRHWVLALPFIQRYTVPALGVIALLLVLYYFGSRMFKQRIEDRLQQVPVDNTMVSRRSSHDLVEI